MSPTSNATWLNPTARGLAYSVIGSSCKMTMSPLELPSVAAWRLRRRTTYDFRAAVALRHQLIRKQQSSRRQWKVSDHESMVIQRAQSTSPGVRQPADRRSTIPETECRESGRYCRAAQH